MSEAKTALTDILDERDIESRRRRLLTFIVVCLMIAFSAEVVAQNLRNLGVIDSMTDEFLSLFAIFVLLLPCTCLVMMLENHGLLKLTVVVSVAMVVGNQGLRITEYFSELDEVFIIGLEHPLHDTARWLMLAIGLVLLLATLYFTLLEATHAQLLLRRESQTLLDRMRQCARAEEALRNQEDIYRSAIAQAGAIPYRIDWKTRTYEFFGNGIEELTGYSREELTFNRMQHMPLETVMLGPLSDKTVEQATVLHERGEIRSWQSEYKIVTRYGEERWISDSSIEVADDHGGLSESIGLFIDITDRKVKEEAIRQSERYYRALIENASDLITIINRDGTIKYESPSVRPMLGYAPEELVGKSVFSLIHRDDLAAVMKTFSEALEDASAPRSTVLRCRHKDGSFRVLEAVGRSMLNEPTVRGIIINSRDITERKQLEEQLLQSQKMQGIGRLAGGVAHDFNNLLTAIVGYGEIALARVHGNEPAMRNIEQLLSAARRAGDLTRQLLAFARRQIIEPKIVNLNELALNMDNMLKRMIGEDIELVTKPKRDLEPVRVDPGQFEQVIVNLAVNARDAMPMGGKLTIETANVFLDAAYAAQHSEVIPGHYVMLAVSDTGVGMDDETLEHIFEPFFTTKESGKGTGLGLATCYGIVKQASGHIWVYSEVGKGTTFKIYLPRAEEVVLPEPAQDAAPAPGGGAETILLVEDEPLVRSVTRETLERYGYTVMEAATGMEALDIAQRFPNKIDLMITDVVMPQMSGKEVAERLKRDRPETAILFISGYAEEAIVHHGMLDRDIEFLSKPYVPAALGRKVRGLLDARTKVPA